MPQKNILNKAYPLSDKTASKWPELASSLASLATKDKTKALVENSSKIVPMGWLGKLISGNAHGMMNPITGTISLNKDIIKEDNADLTSVLSHELKHAEQRKTAGILSLLYGNRDAFEKQAYESELSSPARRDIRLPLLKGQKKDPRIFKNYQK